MKLGLGRDQTGAPWHWVKDAVLTEKSYMSVRQEELKNVVWMHAGRVHDLDAGVEQRTNICQRGFARTIHVPVDDVEQVCENPLKSGGDMKAAVHDNVRNS